MEGGTEQRFRVKSTPYVFLLCPFALRPRSNNPYSFPFSATVWRLSPRARALIRIIIGVIYDLGTRGASAV